MNGQFPPWDAQAGYSHGVTNGSHTQPECRRVDNNDEVPAQHGKVPIDGNYEEISGDPSSTIWPDTSQHKENQELDKIYSNWTSSERSKGVELERDVSCKPSVVYSKSQSPTTETEPEEVHVDPADCTFSNAFEKCRTDELISARNSSVILFAGFKTSVKSSQYLQQRERNFLIDDSSMNDKVQKETTCRTLEQCSSLEFYKNTEICSLGHHVPTKDVVMKSCLSDKLSTVKTNRERHSKILAEFTSTIPSTPSDVIGNEEGTLSLAAYELRQNSKEHTKSYKDNSLSRYVDSHVRTHTPNFESHVPYNSSQTTQHECAGSEMKLNCTTTEYRKPAVSHNRLVTEENVNEKSNTVRRNAFNSAFAEPNSACSTNSVGQLENLVQKVYHKMPPTSALKSTQPFQFQADASTETAADCEDSNLPLGPDGSLDMAANAECTPTQEAASTSKTAVQSPQNGVSSQPQCCSMDAQEPFAFQDSAAEPENLASGGLMKATGKAWVNSPNKKALPRLDSVKNAQQSLFTSENNPQKPKSVLKRQETPRKRKALDCEALTGQVQKRTCESRGTGDYSPLSNLEGSSLNMKGLTEGLNAADVLQCERKKKPEETSHQAEEQLLDAYSAIKTPTSKQEREAIALTAKEGKKVNQSGIKHHITLENAAPVSDQIESPCKVLAACTASTLDVQKPRSNHHIRKCSEKEVNSVHAAYKAEAQNSLHEPFQLSLEGFSIMKSEEPTFEQNTKAAKEKVETYKEPDANLDFDIAFQPVSDLKTEPGEDRDYLKKLRQRQSTSREHFLDCEQTTNNVNPKPDIYPQSCSELPGAYFENISDVLEKGAVSSKAEEPQEDYSSNHAELDLKMDNLKSSKVHAVKKKRAGHSFQKRKLLRLAKPSSAGLKTSRNITVKGLQKISQNNVSRDFKTEVKSEKAQTESSMDSARPNDASSSVQTRSSMKLVLSDTGESPEQKHSIHSHSVATVDPMDSQTCFSNCSVSDRSEQRSPRRPPKKLQKSTRPKTNPMQSPLIHEAEKMDSIKVSKQSHSVASMENDVPLVQISCLSTSATNAENEIRATEPTNLIKQRFSRTCRESTLLKIALATGLDDHTSGQRTSSKMVNQLQALPAHAKKKGKKSKLQMPNMNILSVRHSRRWSRFTRSKIRCLQEPDHNAADDSFSSQQGHRISTIRKMRKHKEKRSALKKSNTTNHLSKSSWDDTDRCQRAAAFDGKDQKTSEVSSLVPPTLFDHYSGVSNGKVIVVATWMPPRAEELNKQCVVADTQLLENNSDTLGSHAMAECRGNPGVEAELKNKSKMSNENPKWVSKRNASSQQANSLPQESSKSFLDCFKSPLQTGIANEVPTLGDAETCSAKVFYADNNMMLLNATVDNVPYALATPESTDKDLKIEKCKEKTRLDEEKKDTPSTEVYGDAAYKLSLQSSVNRAGFSSTETGDKFCHKTIREERSQQLVIDESVEASDLELLVRDVAVKSAGIKVVSEGISLCNSGSRYVSGFAQYFEDFISTLNKGSCAIDDALLPKELAKKCIICKYCGQSFRHISAYTIHRRIHTGEKPYRCRLCGKNFAQLSKLKSHRKVHTQPEALHCPCCSKKFFRKGSLVSHFKIHLQETTQSNGPSRDIKCSSSSAGPLKSFLSDQRLLCKICDKTFPHKSMLRIHMHMHDRKSDLSCATCGKIFQNSSHLQVHKKTHWPVKPYACCICGKAFNRLKALKNHSLGHTGETPFSCSHCGHAFHDLSALRGHQVSKLCRVKGKINGGNCDIEGFLVSQGFEGQINTPVFFKCRICKQLFRKWCQYTLHLETHTKSPPYLCFSCGQSYVKDSDVSIHCKVCCRFSGEEAACRASLSEIFPSDDQKYTFPLSASSLNPSKTKTSSISNGSCSQKDSQTPTHRLHRPEDLNPNSGEVMETSPLPETDTADLHSGSPSPTPSVVTCVSSNDSLECVEITPKVRKFQCPMCGQRYERYRTLQAHMQTHAHGFRYVCGPCGQSFERWNRLWLHQRIHRKKHRCYSCSQCNLQFRFSGSYKAHMLSHAGKRPFACPVCPETFTREKALQAHRREYHQSSKILQCDVCAKTFSNLRNLLKHSRLHNGAVSHQCLSCNLSFTNNKILREHWKTHHNTLSPPLPGLPSEPLAFSHTCKRCKASFSTGDLLYAHQICHFGVQFGPTHTNKCTSSVFGRRSHPHTESTSLSATRPLISMLNLDAVPDDERVYAYPHPDRHYVLPSLSRTRVPIVILDSEGEEDTQPASGDHAFANIDLSGSKRPGESTQFSSETNTTNLPQAEKSQPTECLPAPCTTPSDVSDQGSPNSVTYTDNFVETSVFLEDTNTQKNQELEESFECADCSYSASSLQGLHEHYFLHAFGN